MVTQSYFNERSNDSKVPLERILGQASKIRILRFMAATGLEHSGREIASAVGLSHVKVHTALKELNQYNVVDMRCVGKSILYRLNLKNLRVKTVLLPLFEKEDRLRTILSDIISKYLSKPLPKSVILFGSFASGDAKPNSDIDMLIIASRVKDVPVLKECLQKAEISITIGFGNHLSPLVMDDAEFKRGFKNKNKLIMNIVKYGKVIIGESINDLVKAND